MREQRYIQMTSRNTAHTKALHIGKFSVRHHLKSAHSKAEIAVPAQQVEETAVKVEVKTHVPVAHHSAQAVSVPEVQLPKAEVLDTHTVEVRSSAHNNHDEDNHDELLKTVIENVNIYGQKSKHHMSDHGAPLKFSTLRVALSVIFAVSLVAMGVLSIQKAYKNDSKAMADAASADKTFDPLSAKDVSENMKKLFNEQNDASDFDLSNLTSDTTGVQE